MGLGLKKSMGQGKNKTKKQAMILRREATHEQKMFPKSRPIQENMARDSFMGDMSEGHYYLWVGTGGLGVSKSSRRYWVTEVV